MRNENRVLGRQGARVLTPEEVQRITAKGALHTNNISINPLTFVLDGDAI